MTQPQRPSISKELQAYQETNYSNLELVVDMTRLLHLSFGNKNNQLHSTLKQQGDDLHGILE